jgi:hypothetical protein
MLLPPLPDVYAQIDPAKRVAYWGINGSWTAGATIVPPQQADTEFGAPPGPGIFEAAVVTSGEVTMPINWTQIGTLIAGAKGKWSLTGAPAFLGGRVRGGPVGSNAEDEAESLRQQYGLQPRSFARLRAATKAGLRR